MSLGIGRRDERYDRCMNPSPDVPDALSAMAAAAWALDCAERLFAKATDVPDLEFYETSLEVGRAALSLESFRDIALEIVEIFESKGTTIADMVTGSALRAVIESSREGPAGATNANTFASVASRFASGPPDDLAWSQARRLAYATGELVSRPPQLDRIRPAVLLQQRHRALRLATIRVLHLLPSSAPEREGPQGRTR